MCKVLVASSVIHLAGIARTPVPALETKFGKERPAVVGGLRIVSYSSRFEVFWLLFSCVLFLAWATSSTFLCTICSASLLLPASGLVPQGSPAGQIDPTGSEDCCYYSNLKRSNRRFRFSVVLHGVNFSSSSLSYRRFAWGTCGRLLGNSSSYLLLLICCVWVVGLDSYLLFLLIFLQLYLVGLLKLLDWKMRPA